MVLLKVGVLLMGDRIEVKSLAGAFKLIKDKEVKGVYCVFKKNFPEIKFSGVYTSLDEISEDIKGRMIDILNDEVRELKYKVSRLRKMGVEVNDIDFGLLMFSLKVGILKAEFIVSNFEVVLGILKKGQDELKVFDEDKISAERENRLDERLKKVDLKISERKKFFDEIFVEDEKKEVKGKVCAREKKVSKKKVIKKKKDKKKVKKKVVKKVVKKKKVKKDV